MVYLLFPTDLMKHLQLQCTDCKHLHLHGLIFERKKHKLLAGTTWFIAKTHAWYTYTCMYCMQSVIFYTTYAEKRGHLLLMLVSNTVVLNIISVLDSFSSVQFLVLVVAHSNKAIDEKRRENGHMVAEYTQELILLLPAGKSNSICHNVKLSTKNTPLQHGTPAK